MIHITPVSAQYWTLFLSHLHWQHNNSFWVRRKCESSLMVSGSLHFFVYFLFISDAVSQNTCGNVALEPLSGVQEKLFPLLSISYFSLCQYLSLISMLEQHRVSFLHDNSSSACWSQSHQRAAAACRWRGRQPATTEPRAFTGSLYR